tara:strand:+ start:1931 stop:2797 length:867 start_codon:yes stop_codon:yes gene_type:complete
MNSYIYEIELNGIPLSDFTTIDGVYVGSTTKTPKERFQEHKRGGRFSNKFVKKYGSSMKSFSVNAVSRKDLNKQEQSYAETLRQNGKNVLSGKDAFYNAPIKCPQCSSSLYIMEIEHNGHIAFRCNSRACMYRNDDPMSVTNLIKGDYQNVFDYRERIEFEDGSFFYGVLNRDGISASGERIYKNGDSFKGQFKRVICEDQSTYYLSHGKGTYTYSDGKFAGHKYVGEFKDGNYHGQGTMTWADGHEYEGEFKDGEMDGKGTIGDSTGQKALYIVYFYLLCLLILSIF